METEQVLYRLPSPEWREVFKAEYELQQQEIAERLKYQQELAVGGLKTLTLINGGAMISLFTFIAGANAIFDHRAIWWSFVWFATGLIGTTVAYLAGYFAQAQFMNVAHYDAGNAQRKMVGQPADLDTTSFYKVGNVWLMLATFGAVASLIAFVAGAAVALGGFLPR